MELNFTKKASFILISICCLFSLSLTAQLTVLLDEDLNCATSSYCVSIQIESSSSLEIGTSSIFVDYNENALQFASYTSTTFNGDSKCIADVAAAWDVHSFDGTSVPGDFNLTMTLLNNTFSCPSVTGTPIEVGIICFDVADGKADPTVTVNLDNTQFNSAATNDGSNSINVAVGNGLSGALLDCSIPCIGQGGDSDNDGVCDEDDQCPNFDDGLLGQACDDGDACTTGDVYTNCGCAGSPAQDSDNDGICDVLDVCPNFDDNQVGQACDDSNACTTNDTVNENCQCVGTMQDTDNDGVCDADDQCPNFDDGLLGQACDDGDPCTTGDVYTNCGCSGGVTAQDSDNDGICDVLDKCPNDANNGCVPTLCPSTGKITRHEHIQQVEINTITNQSGQEGYGNFLSMSTNLQKGQSYPITLTPSFGNNGTYTQFWNVWIDFNQDGDFDDAGEKVVSQSGTGSVDGNITIPTTSIFNGPTTMRVTMQWEVEPASCGEICYGEVEDYSVNIL